LREWYVNNQPRKGATSSTDEPPAPAPKDTHAKGPVTVKQAEKNRKRRLVRRQYMSTIVAAWVITVPLSAGLAAVLFAGLEALWP
jgi:PiT family inorganic phosphate transporter